MAKNDKLDPIQLEDLLRLKKHEQPDDAFWADFEKSLHKKTLQALVKPQPLRVRLLSRVQGMLHPAFAMPAAAALAVGAFLAPQSLFTTSEDSTPKADLIAYATDNQPLADFDMAQTEAQFATNTIEASSAIKHEHFTQLRSNQELTTDMDNIHYVASTYTAGQTAYAAMSTNAVY